MRPHRQQPIRLLCPWDSPGKNTGVGCHFLLQCMTVKSESEIAQSCSTLTDHMDCSPPGSSIHGIFQARALEWVALAFSAIQHTTTTTKLLQSCLTQYSIGGIKMVFVLIKVISAFPGSSAGKEFACNAGDLGSISRLRRSPGGGHGNPLQYCCLENPHGQRSLVGSVHGIAKSRT